MKFRKKSRLFYLLCPLSLWLVAKVEIVKMWKEETAKETSSAKKIGVIQIWQTTLLLKEQDKVLKMK